MEWMVTHADDEFLRALYWKWTFFWGFRVLYWDNEYDWNDIVNVAKNIDGQCIGNVS